jgi:hypothetical protein
LRGLQEFVNVNVCVAECTPQSVAVHFVVEREDDYPTVGMLHLYVTALAVNFDEAQARERGKNFSSRENWKFHIVNSTSS